MAARAYKILALGASTLEGIGVRRGEPVLETAVSRRFPPTADDSLANLAAQVDVALAGENWEGSQVVLVFPSSDISLRKLEFPFRDPRKIDQALVFELENELLDDVGNFVYFNLIVPDEDEMATVLVYLVPAQYLHGYLDIMQEKNLTPIRITFSAQALHQLHESPSPLHYQVYLGADEVFASSISGGRLQAVKTFSFNQARIFPPPPGGEEPRALASAEITPAELLDWMREPTDGGGEPGEGASQTWREEFEGLATDIMRFIGPHSLGQQFTLSLHGLFAPFFEWREESGRLRLVAAGETGPAAGRPSFWGIMEELAASPGSLFSRGGVNFFQSRSGFGQQLREFGRPLMAMAAFAILILALVGINFGMKISAHQAELDRIDGEIAALIKKSVSGKRSVVQSMRILEERLAKVRKESTASARFIPFKYDTMVLLRELSGLFKESPQLSLTALSLKGDRFTLSGTTQSYDASESFKNKLAKLDRFKKAEAAITHQRNRSDITFRIVINGNAQ